MKKLITTLKRLALRIIIIFFGSSVLLAFCYRFVSPVATPLMLIRCWQQITSHQSLKLSKKWISVESVSPYMIQAVIASEDNRFMEHYGFDFEAIKKARQMNQKRKKVFGASTISQQTAKNIFLWPQRSYLRKGLEVYFTLLIEILWSKQRIMEMYLNNIETGKGIYGVEAAAHEYFQKSASMLTKSEAAYIASILPNPRKWDPRRPTSYLKRRHGKIISVMSQLGDTGFNSK